MSCLPGTVPLDAWCPGVIVTCRPFHSQECPGLNDKYVVLLASIPGGGDRIRKGTEWGRLMPSGGHIPVLKRAASSFLLSTEFSDPGPRPEQAPCEVLAQVGFQVGGEGLRHLCFCHELTDAHLGVASGPSRGTRGLRTPPSAPWQQPSHSATGRPPSPSVGGRLSPAVWSGPLSHIQYDGHDQGNAPLTLGFARLIKKRNFLFF